MQPRALDGQAKADNLALSGEEIAALRLCSGDHISQKRAGRRKLNGIAQVGTAESNDDHALTVAVDAGGSART
jgi:predicted DNA-binding protein (UPF0251 family)